MEAPPAFSAPPPPKKSNTLLIVILVIVGLCVICCGGGIFFVMKMGQKMGGMMSCSTHYAFALQATKLYANDHGGKLPDAAKWQDEIGPYYGKNQGSDQKVKNVGFFDFGDPSKNLGCAQGDDGPATGMSFNTEVAGKSLSSVRDNPSQILFFEVPTTARNQSGPYKIQPGTSPQKMLGSPRPWLYITAGGQLSVNGASTNQNNPFNQGL
jgi:hypothetical protein